MNGLSWSGLMTYYEVVNGRNPDDPWGEDFLRAIETHHYIGHGIESSGKCYRCVRGIRDAYTAALYVCAASAAWDATVALLNHD